MGAALVFQKCCRICNHRHCCQQGVPHLSTTNCVAYVVTGRVVKKGCHLYIKLWVSHMSSPAGLSTKGADFVVHKLCRICRHQRFPHLATPSVCIWRIHTVLPLSSTTVAAFVIDNCCRIRRRQLCSRFVVNNNTFANTFMGYTKFDVSSQLKSNGKPNRRYTLHRYRSKPQPFDRCSLIEFSCDHEVMSQCFLLIITAH